MQATKAGDLGAAQSLAGQVDLEAKDKDGEVEKATVHDVATGPTQQAKVGATVLRSSRVGKLEGLGDCSFIIIS